MNPIQEKQSKYEYRFHLEILENSQADTFHLASYEWFFDGFKEDPEKFSSCVCTHPHIRYLYRIKNRITKKILFPVGSSCILRLENKDIKELMNVVETWGKRKFPKNSKWHERTFEEMRQSRQGKAYYEYLRQTYLKNQKYKNFIKYYDIMEKYSIKGEDIEAQSGEEVREVFHPYKGSVCIATS